jgi:signal transduction histidine kinase/CheY-like chemotaxis protein
MRHLAPCADPDPGVLTAALEAVTEGVVIADARGVVTFLNPAAERLLRTTAAAVAGRPLAEAVTLPPDGPVAHRLVPLPAATGGLAGSVVVLADASAAAGTDTGDRQRLQVQLMQADRMASVGTLAAGVAHEINNPLAYVLANLEYIASELGELAASAPDERMTELLQALEEAREGAERVRHIVRDLKTFSRPNEEQSGPVDLRRVIEASINMVFNEIKHRARLVKDYAATPPVEANESRLGQVFLNLLLNAAQAIPDGATDRNRIRIVTGTDSQGRVVAEVHDTGTGMPPEVVARLFDPFFTTKPIGVGTGLGLPICRSIVTALGGTIEVESEVGVGSMFRVVLPAAKPRRAEEKPAASPTPAGRTGRILVIDDEPMVLAAVRRCMTPEHEVTTEGNAAAALHRLHDGERFDLIICDLMMPQVSGLDLYEELAATEPDLLHKLVFLTGGAFTPRAREFLDRVPNARMEKPFEGPQLLALVRSLLG